MATPPSCTRLGRHCRELQVTVRISDLDDDSLTLQDASATWMTAHGERISWGEPYVVDRLLMVDATIHVPCRYYRSQEGQAHCTAHGFRGRAPRSVRPAPPRLQLGGGRFSVIQGKKRRVLRLPPEEPDGRSLPVIQEENPCLQAACRTSDNRVGAACCRDLTLELEAPARRTRFEELLRSRKAPYVCRVQRDDDETMACEVISACGYLSEEDHISCTLHGRVRPNGKQAKPSLCYEWPELDEDETGHPGCVFT